MDEIRVKAITDEIEFLRCVLREIYKLADPIEQRIEILKRKKKKELTQS